MPTGTNQIWWVFVAAVVVGLILSLAFVASVVIQQRRFLAATKGFGGRLLAAQEEERAWLARELHDDIIQRVAMLGHELEVLEKDDAAEPAPAPALGRLAAIRGELDELAGGIRGLAHRVHPAALDHLGLPAALVQLGSEFQAQGLDVRVSVATGARTVREPMATALYRVAQESLRNVQRHAGTGSADLRLRADADGITLEVEDGGVGFDPSAAASKAGLGLTSLRERLELVQGRVMIRSTPGGGTRVTAWAPSKDLEPELELELEPEPEPEPELEPGPDMEPT